MMTDDLKFLMSTLLTLVILLYVAELLASILKRDKGEKVMKGHITQEEFCFFRQWLERRGVEFLPTTNDYELIRWKHEKAGRPMAICYRRDRTEFITVNSGAYDYFEKYQSDIENWEYPYENS